MRVVRRWSLAIGAAAAALGCDDAETIIAVYGPAAPVDAGDGRPDAAPSEAGSPDAAAAAAAFYLEAEDGVLSGAFTVGQSDAASGGAFIVASEAADPDTEPGSARALYTLPIAQPGDYVIWGRIHAPGADRNRYWARVDEGQWFLWRISTGEAWYWDDFHDDKSYGVPLTFALDAGEHRLELANAVLGAELDRLYVTALNDHPPGNTTPCNPPHSVELAGVCERSCGSYGDVSCEPDLCQGLPELRAYDCAVCCQPP